MDFMKNEFTLLRKLFSRPAKISTDPLAGIQGKDGLRALSQDEKDIIRKSGITTKDLQDAVAQELEVNYDRSIIYKEVDRCLSGDTLIWLLDGTVVPIKEMTEHPDKYIGKATFSVNEQTLNLEPDKIVACRKTGEGVSLIRVYLDNEKYIDCTPDHRFLLRDGSYKEAKDLIEGQSLMPLYTRYFSQGALQEYPAVYNPGTGKWAYTHTYVAEKVYGYKQTKGFLIHHIDFNKQNAEPENLQIMSKSNHCKLHGSHAKKGSESPNWIPRETRVCQCSPGCTETFVCEITSDQKYFPKHIPKGDRSPYYGIPQSEERREKQRKAMKGVLKGRKLSKQARSTNYLINNPQAMWGNPEIKEKLLVHLKEMQENNIGKHYDKTHSGPALCRTFITRFCACGCGAQFKVSFESGSNRYVHGHNNKGKKMGPRSEESRLHIKEGIASYRQKLILNHKVVKVEYLPGTQDVYDITMEKNPNFAVEAGVFVHNCREHPMMASALGLFSDTASGFNSLQNRSVWITSDSTKYVNELTKLFDRIGIEEKIYDWTWSTALYGDLFPKVEGQPGFGVISVDDSDHPANLSRIDVNGVLIGFFNASGGTDSQRTSLSIIPPWEYVHFRLLGAKRRRNQGNDPTYQEYRTIHMMSGDNRVASSNYGISVLIDGLPVWKRLRLSEDSIMLTRLTRGLLRYIYKIRVDSWETESVSELMDEYVGLLKQARAMNTDPNNPSFDSKFGIMSAMEDVIVPVWGEQGDITIDKIGGDPDIRWITDIERLENQLAMALRVPKSLLGGSVADATGALGSEALSMLDIQFAKTAKRLQRAIKEGLTRICQIHLAYMNMDPDPALFEVNMTETSSAEEERLKDTLDTGADIIDKYLGMFNEMAEANPGLKFDQVEFFNYMNEKILKLNDLDINDYITVEEAPQQVQPTEAPEGGMGAGPSMKETPYEENVPDTEPDVEEDFGDDGVEGTEALPSNMAPPDKLPIEDKVKRLSAKELINEYNKKTKAAQGKKAVRNLDLTAPLPLQTKVKSIALTEAAWKEKYGDLTIKIEEKKPAKKK